MIKINIFLIVLFLTNAINVSSQIKYNFSAGGILSYASVQKTYTEGEKYSQVHSAAGLGYSAVAEICPVNYMSLRLSYSVQSFRAKSITETPNNQTYQLIENTYEQTSSASEKSLNVGVAFALPNSSRFTPYVLPEIAYSLGSASKTTVESHILLTENSDYIHLTQIFYPENSLNFCLKSGVKIKLSNSIFFNVEYGYRFGNSVITTLNYEVYPDFPELFSSEIFDVEPAKHSYTVGFGLNVSEFFVKKTNNENSIHL